MQLSAIGAASEVIVLWCCTADCGCSSWYSVWCGLMWVDVKSDFGHFWSLEKHADGCVWLTVFYSNFRSMSKCCWPENRNPQQESLSLTARRGVVNCCTTIQLYNKSTTNRSIMEFKGYSWSTCSSLNSHCAFTVGVVNHLHSRRTLLTTQSTFRGEIILKSRVWDFQREVRIFLNILKFPYNTVWTVEHVKGSLQTKTELDSSSHFDTIGLDSWASSKKLPWFCSFLPWFSYIPSYKETQVSTKYGYFGLWTLLNFGLRKFRHLGPKLPDRNKILRKLHTTWTLKNYLFIILGMLLFNYPLVVAIGTSDEIFCLFLFYFFVTKAT